MNEKEYDEAFGDRILKNEIVLIDECISCKNKCHSHSTLFCLKHLAKHSFYHLFFHGSFSKETKKLLEKRNFLFCD